VVKKPSETPSMNARALERLLLAFVYCKNKSGSTDSVVAFYKHP
jgi:hypothetical protein